MYLIRCIPKQCEYDTFHPPQNRSSFSKQLRYFHFFLEIVEHLPCIPVTCPLSSKLFVCWCIFSTWFHVLKNMRVCVCVFIDCTVSKHQLGCNMFLNEKCKFECFFFFFFYDVPAPHNGLIGGLSLFTLCIVNMVLNSHISECRSGFCILASIKISLL